jgi:hypothetical protein
MSKFVDKLRNLSKPSTSIGFHPAASKAKNSPMLLIAGLLGEDVKEAEAVANSNVDAGLLLSQSLSTKDVKQVVRTMGDIPLGVFLKDMSKEKAAKFADSGCDFVVFDMRMPIALMQEGGIGKFLLAESSLDSGLVRAINALDIDGVLINCVEGSFITVEYLLTCQRFSELANKPLLTNLSSLPTNIELGNLWKVGIDGVVIPPMQAAEAFVELRKAIDNLPREVKRRQGKVAAMLPHYGDSGTIDEEEEI